MNEQYKWFDDLKKTDQCTQAKCNIAKLILVQEKNLDYESYPTVPSPPATMIYDRMLYSSSN